MKTFRQTVLDHAKAFADRGLDARKFGFKPDVLLARESEFEPVGNGWKDKSSSIEASQTGDGTPVPPKVGDGTLILAGTHVRTACEFGENCFIGPGNRIDLHNKFHDNVVVGPENKFGVGNVIGPGTSIDAFNYFHRFVHAVQDVRIGSHCVISEGTIGKGKIIPDNCLMGNDSRQFVSLSKDGELGQLVPHRIIEHRRGRLDNPDALVSGLGETVTVTHSGGVSK